MYHAYLLLKADTDFTFEKARDRLAERFPGANFKSADWSLIMSTDDWEIGLQLNEGQEVLLESQQIAEHVTGAEDEQGIGTCDRRVEIATDVPDPEMDHFEKFQRVIEAMHTFHGAILVDPQEPSLL